MSGSKQFLTHVRIQLALHELRPGSGRALMLLHGLGEHSPSTVPEAVAGWGGPIYALDFTGHGESTVPAGGGYTAEVLMGDVATALDAVGEATLLGRGLGAYIALLAAGARPLLVAGAILCDGPGLAGGGPAPHTPSFTRPFPADRPLRAPDPYALLELAKDVRPADYASTYVRQTLEFSGLDEPITVAAVVRPPWLEAVAGHEGVASGTVAEALDRYARAERHPR